MIAILTPIILSAGGAVVGEGIGTLLRPRPATVGANRPGDFVRVAQELTRLRAQGLDPTVSSSPFTGDIVIATSDQAPILEQLTLEAALREITQPSRALSEAIFLAREQFIESRRGVRAIPIERSRFARLPSRPSLRQPPGAVRSLLGRTALFTRRAPAGPLAVRR